jgi:hypothetical protein
VADHDLPLFHDLEGPHRTVLPDSALLPSWLKSLRIPLDPSRKWRWISTSPGNQIWPMSGWHVQQLRKILIARHIMEDVMVMADSDSLFVRPITAEHFVRHGHVRLYVKENAISFAPDGLQGKHMNWTNAAAAVLGQPAPAYPAHDYINNLVSWRRDHVLAMISTVEAATGRDFVTALGKHRSFSEYQLYGRFIEAIKGDTGHWASSEPLGHTYWSGAALDEQGLRDFTTTLTPDQIALGIQSFTETPISVLRSYLDNISGAKV